MYLILLHWNTIPLAPIEESSPPVGRGGHKHTICDEMVQVNWQSFRGNTIPIPLIWLKHMRVFINRLLYQFEKRGSSEVPLRTDIMPTNGEIHTNWKYHDQGQHNHITVCDIRDIMSF